jgi:universal stress protein A
MMHVVEYLPPIDSAYEPILASNWNIDEKLLLEQAEKSLQKMADKYQLGDAAQHVVLGTPKYEISQFVKDHGCDLVVLGSHGQHGISLLLGSTANAVLHDMPCDVLAVKVSK